MIHLLVSLTLFYDGNPLAVLSLDCQKTKIYAVQRQVNTYTNASVFSKKEFSPKYYEKYEIFVSFNTSTTKQHYLSKEQLTVLSAVSIFLDIWDKG